MNPMVATLRNMMRPVATPVIMAWERMESGISYNPLSPAIRADPYPVYERLRRKDPVHRMRLYNGWLLTKFDDVDAVLRNAKVFGKLGSETGYLHPRVSLLDLDPPEHTKIRALVSRAFTPRSVAALEPRIREAMDGLLANVENKKRFDVMEEFAHPLPIIVIAEMLGVPPEDREQFHKWTNIIASVVEPLLTARQIRELQQAIEEIFTYLDAVVEERRRDPQDDIVTVLVEAEVDGERLSRDDLLSNLVTLLVAGNETTRNLIGNGTLALLQNPGELQRLCDDPGMLRGAIDELLRFVNPVQLDARVAREPVELRGKQIKPGQKVILALGAANRDPEVFADPDRLDVGREDVNHLAFGRGIHYCLAAALARLEGRVAFEGLLPRLANSRLVEEPRFRDTVTSRGLESLWLEMA